MTVIDAIVLGIVEGLTEFLPVSSTGHLILASALAGIKQTEGHKVFEVTIQSGAILAVVFLYWDRLKAKSPLMRKVCVGFLPTGFLGFVLYKYIKAFFRPSTVSVALIAGGVAFIAIEWYLKKRPRREAGIEEITYGKALAIGAMQSLAMIPGVSRSGATIMGALLVGVERNAATEFSFLLAIPTMLAATVFDVYKNLGAFGSGQWELIVVGFVTSFIFAILGIKFLVRFVASHTFIPFGIYRIAAGILFLLFLPS